MPGDGPAGLFVGLATLDVVQLVVHLPEPNRKTVATRTWLSAGGPAAVAAITFACLGGSSRLWTALGRSSAAGLAAADLAGAGVEVIDVAPPGFELAVSTAFVDAASGERAVVSGSAHRPDLGEVARPNLAGIDVVLIDGHHAALAAAAVAAAGGRPVVVDAGSHKPVFDEVLGHCTDVICSADYVHPDGLSPADLVGRGPELAARSRGGDPLQWWTAADHGEVEVPVVPVRDTLGAGDVLHGAYAFALASGFARPEALVRAVAVASARVGAAGPQRWRQEVRNSFSNGVAPATRLPSG